MKYIIAILLLISTVTAEPLVYVSSWNTGSNPKAIGQNLSAQLDRIEEGEYILPVIQLPANGKLGSSASLEDITRLTETGLPLSIRINNFSTYVVDRGVSRDENWVAVGVDAAQWLIDAGVCDAYPNPPAVYMVDNHEGAGKDFETPERLRLLHNGFNSTLPESWRSVVKHIMYTVEPVNDQLGRGGGYREDDVDLTVNEWTDGGCSSSGYYDWTSENDTSVRSPNGFAMNLAYGNHLMINEGRTWRQELGVWTGGQDKIDVIGLTPERYEGGALFQSFVIRAPVIRQFESSSTPFAEYEPYTRALYRVAKRINDDDIVRRFWEQGEPIISTIRHPNDKPKGDFIPPNLEWRNLMFDCDANPRQNETGWPWDQLAQDFIKVWSCGYHIGEHEFLIFAQAPLGVDDVNITVPGLGEVHFDSLPPEGIFSYVNTELNSPWVDYEMKLNGEIVPIQLRAIEP